VTNSRRVLFVVNDARFFVTHRLALARGVREAGYDVHVATPPTEGAARVIQDASFPVHLLSIDRQGINPVRELVVLSELVRLYARLRPDIVHHVTVKPVLYGTLAARVTRVPAVVNAISGLGRLFAFESSVGRVRVGVMHALYRMLLRHPNMYAIFQNESDRTRLIQARIASAATSTVVPGSGTELRRFTPSGKADMPPIVLLPARILRQKGVYEFCDAARKLNSEGLDARFAIAGDVAGNRDALSARELGELRKEGIVELWGWVDDMPSAMNRASIICLPSYHEGLPKALIDGCAAGRPIVATDVPGCRAVVQHGINGFLVPVKDSVALADALRLLLSDGELRRRFGTAARQIAEGRFDVASVIAATTGIYSTLLSSPSIATDFGHKT